MQSESGQKQCGDCKIAYHISMPIGYKHKMLFGNIEFALDDPPEELVFDKYAYIRTDKVNKFWAKEDQ